jgi:hypothetical protein
VVAAAVGVATVDPGARVGAGVVGGVVTRGVGVGLTVGLTVGWTVGGADAGGVGGGGSGFTNVTSIVALPVGVNVHVSSWSRHGPEPQPPNSESPVGVAVSVRDTFLK